ncbi:hypothetical protein IFM89_004264 [Coptis chinensis]|uniref:Aldehyde dehydrogenase 1 n=1 Tax=Coptis chinensis TaxID=261450 RepID=A0A835I932_9MAGN|nr:hypothetical protein IFM89_004264 [Coptis chinensis]
MAIESNGNSCNNSFKIPKIKFTKLFINGDFVDAISGKTFETIDPRTGDVITRVAEGDKEDVDLAVKAARDAFDNGKWPRMPGFDRGRIMMKFADLIDENIDELAALDSIDAGKLFSWGKGLDIPQSAHLLRYYAGAADKIHGETLKMSRELQGYTLREPIGVVGHIIPWNFPSTMFFMKVAPALAAGCTMIVKPAEQTPLSALFYAHLAKQAGIPDGVLNVVTGFGPKAGAGISSHMDVDKARSTEVGRLVMQAAALSNLKSVSLELGGKSPIVIFDDADVDIAVDLAILGILFNKGEICVAGSRVYVQEGIYDEFVKKAAEKAKAWVVGDPFDPLAQQGPQVDKNQFEKILSYIEHGKREGATLLTGGKACGEKGYYIEPTIFTDVKEDMLIVKDEIFGPVMCLMKFKTVEEAIERANNTRYGLAAGIVTNDLNTANRVSRSIRAGVIWINCYFAFDRDCPYGGYKMSGFGRDQGMHALEKYLNVKFDFVAPSNLFEEKKGWMDKLKVLQKLASEEGSSATIFKAIADPPTTSLQRLKGLTTGGLPTFIDVGNSFGAPAIIEDNLLNQLNRNGKRVWMMGDDTWVHLFPDHFEKSFPFPSFNVKDLDTVDDGCVQHLFPSLYEEEWDVLIAHFLGVDHAGHIFGVDSMPMIHKLEQYNTILEIVHQIAYGTNGQMRHPKAVVVGDNHLARHNVTK